LVRTGEESAPNAAKATTGDVRCFVIRDIVQIARDIYRDFLMEHDLFRKPIPTFRDHAPAFFCSHFRTENRIPLFLKVL